jgi:hypothetical protein
MRNNHAVAKVLLSAGASTDTALVSDPHLLFSFDVLLISLYLFTSHFFFSFHPSYLPALRLIQFGWFNCLYASCLSHAPSVTEVFLEAGCRMAPGQPVRAFMN